MQTKSLLNCVQEVFRSISGIMGAAGIPTPQSMASVGEEGHAALCEIMLRCTISLRCLLIWLSAQEKSDNKNIFVRYSKIKVLVLKITYIIQFLQLFPNLHIIHICPMRLSAAHSPHYIPLPHRLTKPDPTISTIPTSNSSPVANLCRPYQ
jgi:hypothetical protein